MAVRRLNHAVLYVNGLERTVDFYRATLGFEVRLQIPGRAAFLRAPGSANDHDLGLFEIGVGRAPDRPEHPGSPPGLGGRYAGRPGRDAGAAEPGSGRCWWGRATTGVQVAVRQGPERCRVRGLVAGAAADWEAELSDGEMILPLDLDAAIARWGQDQATGAAAGSPT